MLGGPGAPHTRHPTYHTLLIHTHAGSRPHREPADPSAVVGTSHSRLASLMAIAFLIVSAVHRRMTTGGPILTVNGFSDLRCSTIGSNQEAALLAYRSRTGPSGKYARERSKPGGRR